MALDFPDTANSLGKNAEQLSTGGVRGYNVIQSEKRTRLVLNLNQAMSYETRMEGNQVYVTLTKVAGAIVADNKVSQFAESKYAATSHSIRSINFRRGSGGKGG